MTSNPSRSHLSRVKSFAAIASTGLFVASGCSMFHSADEADSNEPIRPATTQQTFSSASQVPLSLQPAHRPVVQAQLPLIYLVESNGTVRISNVDTAEEIITFPVKQSQIVRVESKGVLLSNRQVIGAQLVPGTYAIEMLPDGAVSAGVLQSSQTITRAVPAAATKPAAAGPKPAASPLEPPRRSPSAPRASPVPQ